MFNVLSLQQEQQHNNGDIIVCINVHLIVLFRTKEVPLYLCTRVQIHCNLLAIHRFSSHVLKTRFLQCWKHSSFNVDFDTKQIVVPSDQYWPGFVTNDLMILIDS